MVIISYKVQKTVNNDTVKLIVEVHPIKRSILTDRIDADKKISGQSLSLAIVKGNDISKIIVSQIFYIDIQNIIIGTEYHRNIAEPFDFALCDKFKPAGSEPLTLEFELDILGKITDHCDKGR